MNTVKWYPLMNTGLLLFRFTQAVQLNPYDALFPQNERDCLCHGFQKGKWLLLVYLALLLNIKEEI